MVGGVGKSYKLALATVCVYDFAEARDHIQRKRIEAEKHLAALSALKACRYSLRRSRRDSPYFA